MRLVAINPDGFPGENIPQLPPLAADIGSAYVELYQAAGYRPPWLGYFAVDDSTCIGTCGFKSPPVANRVEIAYFTFPRFEGRGFATRMARMLLEIAWTADSTLVVAAQTLPCEGASTALLRTLGFRLCGNVHHPEDGEVWEWQRSREIAAQGSSA